MRKAKLSATNSLFKAVAVGAAAVSLAACGGDDSSPTPSPTPTPTPTPTPVSKVDGFGSGFAALYRTDPNTAPRKPTAADLNGVDPTAQAVDLP